MVQGRGRLPSTEIHKLEGLAHEAEGAKGHPFQTKSGLGFAYGFITRLLAFILRAHGLSEKAELKANYVDEAALSPGPHEVECKLLSGRCCRGRETWSGSAPGIWNNPDLA